MRVPRYQVRKCARCGGVDEYLVGSPLEQSCTTCEVVALQAPVCACPCRAPIGHLRADARYVDRAHRTAEWKRRSGYHHPKPETASEASPRAGGAA